MTCKDFKSTLKKVRGKRIHKTTNSLGVYDAYKWIRKNKWFDIGRPLTEKEFYSIIRAVNEELACLLSNGQEVTLPERMGKIELRKQDPFIGFKDGKLHVHLAIDWDQTLQLWYEDQEAFEKKQLIKIPEKHIFKFIYTKTRATYPNKSFFELVINRQIKLNIKNKIKQGTIDAFLRYG